jgi:hypothetical protein
MDTGPCFNDPHPANKRVDMALVDVAATEIVVVVLMMKSSKITGKKTPGEPGHHEKLPVKRHRGEPGHKITGTRFRRKSKVKYR